MTLEDLGLNVGRLVAGFSGGVLAAVCLRIKTPSSVIGSLLAGTLTANFLGPAAAHYMPDWTSGAVNFAVGLSAMAICQGVIAVVEARMKRMEKTGGEQS